MSYGASDCCSTCWLNIKLDSEGTEDQPKEAYCQIRKLSIADPGSTYCSNHQLHNQKKLYPPIGPVYVHDPQAPHSRRIWLDSPDTEEIRLTLVRALERMPEIPEEEYAFGKRFDEEVIQQLAIFREKRAIPGLMRVLTFDPQAESQGDHIVKTTRMNSVALAIEALARISGDPSLQTWEHFIHYGLEDFENSDQPYYAGEDKKAIIRFHTVKGLKYCDSARAMDLLHTATLDPHEEIRKFANAQLAEKSGIRQAKELMQAIKTDSPKKKSRWKFWK